MKVLAIAMLGVLAVLVVVAAWVAVPTAPAPSPVVASAGCGRAIGHTGIAIVLARADARRKGDAAARHRRPSSWAGPG